MTTSSYSPSQMQPSSSEGDCPGEGLVACGHDLHDLDVTKRDRFELLSAYLDGEVTPAERQRVLSWLQHDPSTRCLYNRLLALRQGMRTQTVDDSCAELTAATVFRGVNRRFRLAAMAGAGVAALGLIQVLSGDVGRPGLWQGSLAVRPDASHAEALHIDLGQPAFPIPDVVAVPASATVIEPASPLPTNPEL